MNLVGYTATALSSNDITDTPKDKNVVSGAIVELKTLEGDLVTIYDDADGTNPETQKACDSDGQCEFYAEEGGYNLEVNGKVNKISLFFNKDKVNDLAAWGDRFVGCFSDGFTYTKADDVARGVDGKYYSYGGASAYPVVVTVGTVPSEPDYTTVVLSDAESVKNTDGSSAQDTHDATKAMLVSQGLSGNYGFFEKGFTYNAVGDVGIAGNGSIYTYSGSATLPVAVAAQTNPAGDANYTPYFLRSNYTSKVANISDLKNLDMGLRVNDAIHVSEYHTGSGVGAGVWRVSSGEVGNNIDIVQSNADANLQFVLVKQDGMDIRSFGCIEGIADNTVRLQRIESLDYSYSVFGDYTATGLSSLSRSYTGEGLVILGSGKRLIVGSLPSRVTNFSSANPDSSTQRSSGVWLLDNGEGIEEFPDGEIHNLIAGGARKGLYRSKYKAYANLSVSIGPKHTVEGLATQFIGISKHAPRPDVLRYDYVHSTGTTQYSYSSYYLDPNDLNVYWPTKTDGNKKVLGVDYTVTNGTAKTDPAFFNSSSQEVSSGYLNATINLINQPANGETITIDTAGNSHNGSIGGADQHLWGNYQAHCGGLGIRYTAQATRASGLGGFQHYISGSHYAALSGREIEGSGNYSANISGRELDVFGDYGFASGYFNQLNADYSSVHGLNSVTDGQYGTAHGNRAHSYVRGMHAKSSTSFGGLGDCQCSSIILSRRIVSVTGTPTPLKLDGAFLDFIIPENKYITLTGRVVAAEEGGGDCSSYSFFGYLRRDAGNSASGVITVNEIQADDALSQLSFTVNANGTLQVLTITPVGKTYRWVCSIELTEVGV